MALPPEQMRSAVDAERARVRVGFPWWLRPFLMSDVIAITLGHWIFVSRKAIDRSEEYICGLLRHELVHVKQVNRHGFLKFVFLYLAEFFRHFLRERSINRAYHRISFEIEAEAAEKAEGL